MGITDYLCRFRKTFLKQNKLRIMRKPHERVKKIHPSVVMRPPFCVLYV